MSSATTIAINLVAVLLLVAANGFFVAAEFALVGVRSSRIETLVAAGNRTAKRLMALLQNLNAYLSACQLGITLASLALGWIGEPAIARLLEGSLSGFSDAWRHGIAFFIAFSIITSLHIVLGEQAPKLMGLARAKPINFGACSPSTICSEVMIEKAMKKAMPCRHASEKPDNEPSSSRAIAGSPIQPRASEASVIPSWQADK